MENTFDLSLQQMHVFRVHICAVHIVHRVGNKLDNVVNFEHIVDL